MIKNTLVRRALEDTAFGDLERLLEGPNGWVFAYDDPVVLSKTLVKFADDNEKFAIKGGVFEGEFMDPGAGQGLVADAEQARAAGQVARDDHAPATQLVRLIQEPGARMVRLIERTRPQKSQAE